MRKSSNSSTAFNPFKTALMSQREFIQSIKMLVTLREKIAAFVFDSGQINSGKGNGEKFRT